MWEVEDGEDDFYGGAVEDCGCTSHHGSQDDDDDQRLTPIGHDRKRSAPALWAKGLRMVTVRGTHLPEVIA